MAGSDWPLCKCQSEQPEPATHFLSVRVMWFPPPASLLPRPPPPALSQSCIIVVVFSLRLAVASLPFSLNLLYIQIQLGIATPLPHITQFHRQYGILSTLYFFLIY